MPLVLGGVAIDHPRGLAGHSDGDVIAHALTDALLGAAGLGDIGALFPSSDERYRGATRLVLLARGVLPGAGGGLRARQRRLRADRAGAAHRRPPRRRWARGSRERSSARTARSASARRRRTSSASRGAARASPRRRWHCCALPGLSRPRTDSAGAVPASHTPGSEAAHGRRCCAATVPTGGALAPLGRVGVVSAWRGSGQADGTVGGEHDEPVAGERVDRLAVEVVPRRRPRRDERAAPPRAAGGTSPRTRTACAAARSASRATGRRAASGQTPQRGMRARQTVAPRSKSACAHAAVERVAGALARRGRRCVDGQHVVAEGEVARPRPRCTGRRRAARVRSSGQPSRGDELRRAVQVRARGGCSRAPATRRITSPGRGGRERLGGRPALEPRRGSAGTTRSTCVCCSITSQTRIAYGSRVRRQGRSRPVRPYQARSSSSTAEL